MTADEQRQAFEVALTADRYDELTHRAFADWLSEQGRDAEAEHHRLWTREWQQAEDWLIRFAENADEEDEGVAAVLKKVVEAGHAALDGRELIQIGFMGFGACNQVCDDEEIKAFWDNWSAYVRRPVPEGGRPAEIFDCCGGNR
jgi:uncharacterized protein (TIGR02996 family)